MDRLTARLVVAAQSPNDGDGVCRFLEAEGSYDVVAEVRDVGQLEQAVLHHQPDVLVLNHRLPGMEGPLALLRTLPLEPSQIVYILPDDLGGRSFEISLKRAGFRWVLAGPFTADVLLQGISQAVPLPRILSVVGLSGGSGQTTVALGLIVCALLNGQAVTAVDTGPRGDLAEVLGKLPPSCQSLLSVAQRVPGDGLVIADGLPGPERCFSIRVAGKTSGSRRGLALVGAGSGPGLLLQNDGVGEGPPVTGRNLLLSRLKPPLLEHPGSVSAQDRRLDAFGAMAKRLGIGGARHGRSRQAGQLAAFQR